jgi:hypothetical protein
LKGENVPVAKLYQNGLTAGIPPGCSEHSRALRSEIKGWSAQASRNNTNFLRSVNIDKLDGVGLTFTLTVKLIPPSSDEWHRVRDMFFKRLKRMGVCRYHWCTEWQKRKAPHLHGIIYFPTISRDEYAGIHTNIKNHWLELTQNYDTLSISQHLKPVDNTLGWIEYLAKHASRGASNYQRSSKNIPPGWRKTGRVWGKSGTWPVEAPIKLTIDSKGFHQLRRLIRKWRCADASKAGDPKRIRAARRMLKSNSFTGSSVRGFSEWVPSLTYYKMIEFVVDEGNYVEC